MNTIHLLMIPRDADIVRQVDAARGIVTVDTTTGTGALASFAVQTWRDADADETTGTKKVDAASSAWSRLRGMAATKCANANVRAAFDAARGEKVDGKVVRYPDAYAATMLRELGKHARASVRAGRPVGFDLLDGTTVLIAANLPDADTVGALRAGPARASRRVAARNYVRALHAPTPLALPAGE